MTMRVGDPWELTEGAVLVPAERIFAPTDVAAFCALSGDGAPIHAVGAQPQIVPGAMLLAAVASFLQGAIRVGNARAAYVAKINGARFPAALRAGDPCRYEGRIATVRKRGQGAFVTTAVTCTDTSSGAVVMAVEVTDFYEV